MSHRVPNVRRLVPLLVAVAASCPRTVWAEAKTACLRDDCEYRFDDEGVNAPGAGVYGPTIVVRGGAARVNLIRPRISFVMSLLKSVEHF
jgi:hypothetical protein